MARLKRFGALRERWRNASLKTSFMVYMLGFLLVALVLSTFTASTFAALYNQTTADAYEVSGLYVYDAVANELVPARSIDLDDQGNELFVERAEADRSPVSPENPPADLQIVSVRFHPYYEVAGDGARLTPTFDEFRALDERLSSLEGEDGIAPGDLAAYDEAARDAFAAWSAEHPGNPYETLLGGGAHAEGESASAAPDAIEALGGRLGDLTASPIGYYLNTTPSEGARFLSGLFGLLTFLMFPLWFGLCIFAAARRFFRLRLEPGLSTLDDAAASIARHDLDFSVVYDRDDELGRLATSFETMRASLEESQRTLWRTAEERKRLNAAFAHDLRTPLTILKGKIELLSARLETGDASPESLAASVASIEAQTTRLEHYVEAMSGLQKLEDRAVVARDVPFDDAAHAIEDIGLALSSQTGERISFALRLSPACDRARPNLRIDQAVVSEVAENLVANALRYAVACVDAHLDACDGDLVLIVEDDGPGFSPAALERGCSPFFSETPSRDHFGLGLNIATLLCEKHGGSLALENRPTGGARVIARFSLECDDVGSR